MSVLIPDNRVGDADDQHLAADRTLGLATGFDRPWRPQERLSTP